MTLKYHDDAAANGVFVVTATIDEENKFTEAAEFKPGRDVSISISGSFTATITLQRSFDDGATWHDVHTWDAPDQDQLIIAEPFVLWRIGVKTGGFTSGTAAVRLSQGK